MKAALLIAALVAYIPSSGFLLKRTAARTSSLGRTREVTLSGTVTVKDQPERPVQLVLRFPLSCRMEGTGAAPLVVRGTPARPTGTIEGAEGPVLDLLKLACPFLSFRGLPAADAEGVLRTAAQSVGADFAAGSALSRLGDRVVYVLGAPPRDLSRPQLWLYKDNAAPARLLAQGGGDLRFLEYGNPAAAEWFPRVIELWQGGQLSARFEVVEARGVRGATEEEEDDSGQ